MIQTIHYTSCPLCGSSAINDFLTAKDHTVSGESFHIWLCSNCTGMFTQDVPGAVRIGKYYQSPDYVSHTNTQKGIVNNLYHLVRKFTLGSKQKLVEDMTQVKTGVLLDVGAGVGAFANFMRSAGWKVRGLEPDPETRMRAREFYNLELEPSEVIYKLEERSFDAITMWHVLEHVHDLHGYLDKIYSLLKPAGKLFIAVPNHTSIDAANYASHWAAYDVPRHLYHFNPHAMDNLLKKHGFKLQSIKPMWFDSFYVSMLSEKYRKGKERLIPALFSGLQSNFKAISDKRKTSSVIYIASK